MSKVSVTEIRKYSRQKKKMLMVEMFIETRRTQSLACYLILHPLFILSGQTYLKENKKNSKNIYALRRKENKFKYIQSLCLVSLDLVSFRLVSSGG